jgi:SAM-dependent methyltransferase
MAAKSKSKRAPRSKPSAQMAEAPITIALPTPTLKLDLGCGDSPAAGYEGVDRFAGAKVTHVVNLFKFPWPWADSSLAELRASHFLEHVPMIEVDDDGNQVPFGEGTDLLFKLMNEAHRVLAPGGWFEIIVPAAHSDRGFQDPTHRRFFVTNTFAYFWKDWREANNLTHYGATCNFVSNVSFAVDSAVSLLHPEAQQKHIQSYWNGIQDILAKMQAVK